jgi:hypothetical protein
MYLGVVAPKGVTSALHTDTDDSLITHAYLACSALLGVNGIDIGVAINV